MSFIAFRLRDVRIRFVNDRDTIDRSYGSIAGLTMLDFTKRATRIRRDNFISTSSEN